MKNLQKGIWSLLKHFEEDINWNIIVEETIIGEAQVLEVSKMVQLKSFPVITIKHIIAEGNMVVVESTGVAKTKEGQSYNRTIAKYFTSMIIIRLKR